MSGADFDLPTPHPSVVFRPLDEGGVLLSTTDEVYFGVNSVGARIWALLPPATQSFSELCTALAKEYPNVAMDRIRRDAESFLRDVVVAGLALAPRGGAPGDSKTPTLPDS